VTLRGAPHESNRPPLFLVVPGPIDQRTGGYLYDARLVHELREAGWTVRVIELPGAYPEPDATTRQRADERFAALPDDTLVMTDALAGSALPELMRSEARRLRLVALVHHPLALETGLDAEQASRLASAERQALAAARQVICTSGSTATALADYDVPAERITVAEPGTDAAELAGGSAVGDPFRLLCVATITPRKGHAVLIDALVALRTRHPSLPWRLELVGSLERSAPTVHALRAALAEHDLQGLVTLHGETSESALADHYERADAFVLASFHEGYGMVLTEALARGLPIVATRGGAIADTVPPDAGLLVEPGDSLALSMALETLLCDVEQRLRLRRGAVAARARLASWRDTADRITSVLDGVCR